MIISRSGTACRASTEFIMQYDFWKMVLEKGLREDEFMGKHFLVDLTKKVL